MTDKLTEEQDEMWEKLKYVEPHTVSFTFDYDTSTRNIILNGSINQSVTVAELYSFLKKEWEDEE